jgi:hypothetical protein
VKASTVALVVLGVAGAAGVAYLLLHKTQEAVTTAPPPKKPSPDLATAVAVDFATKGCQKIPGVGGSGACNTLAKGYVRGAQAVSQWVNTRAADVGHGTVQAAKAVGGGITSAAKSVGHVFSSIF